MNDNKHMDPQFVNGGLGLILTTGCVMGIFVLFLCLVQEGG